MAHAGSVKVGEFYRTKWIGRPSETVLVTWVSRAYTDTSVTMDGKPSRTHGSRQQNCKVMTRTVEWQV